MTNIQRLRPSVFTLVEFAARAAGAIGYSLLCTQPTHPERCAAARYDVRVGGNSVATIEFSFLEHPIPQEKLSILRRMTILIEAVQSLPRESSRRAARIARFDAELADTKIGERARGLLVDGTPAAAGVEAIVRYVKHVLRDRDLGTAFERLLPETEEGAQPK
jgi:hypothetical protein